jgi:hypothetical protein
VFRTSGSTAMTASSGTMLMAGRLGFDESGKLQADPTLCWFWTG